jgi:zinc and cadmium transporter
MQNSALLALLSVLLVSCVSFVGIFFFLVRESAIKKTLMYFVSFSTGALLGDVFIHMFPEMAKEQTFFSTGLLIVLGGIVFSFVMEKIIHWRHCHLLPDDAAEREHCHDVGAMSIFGDATHNFIDGLVIAASFLISPQVGVSTAIAVALHEIPHEIGNFAVLLHSGMKRSRALLLNILSALVAVVGAVLVLASSQTFVGLDRFLLPFAAGNLLYIAGSDLIPELHREEGLDKAFLQLLCMVGGIMIMEVMLLLE